MVVAAESVSAAAKPLPADKPAAATNPSLTLSTDADLQPAKPEIIELLEAEMAPPPPPSDVWQRIRAGMQMPDREHPGTDSEKAWFASHQAYLDRTMERAVPYMHLIIEELEARGMPTELALLPVVESAFQPFAYSHSRAAGIWQFIPGTGERFGLKRSWWYDGRRDVLASTRAALDYLQFLNQEFNGDWLLALAAYNCGEGAVARAIRRNEAAGRGTDFWSLDLPRETRSYVPRLLAISAVVADPTAFGITLQTIPNEPFLTVVNVGSQIDLELAAELAGISIEEIYRYNPGFNRFATDPEGPHRLLLPIDKAEAFRTQMAQLPEERRVQWTQHQVSKGETLASVAAKYRTTASVIKKVNALQRNQVRAGQSLVIPVARRDLPEPVTSVVASAAPASERESSAHSRSYVVRKGDTLWSVARRHSVDVAYLAQWNGLTTRSALRVGQKLTIDGGESGIEKVASAARKLPSKAAAKAADLTRRVAYTVRSGDSLSVISDKFDVSVNDLKKWNRLDEKRHLQPGQRLKVYVTSPRQARKY